MATSVSAGGFTFSKDSIGGTWFWTVLAHNIQGLGQTFCVTDILTPYGKLTDAQIPIPGDVITEMASSLTQLQQQLAAAITLVSGTPTTYSTTVTEGDAALVLTSVPFSNTGAFGSFLTVTATPDSPWISASPTQQTGVGKNQTAQFTIKINPATMLASGSPYAGHVVLQDANGSTHANLTINVTVLPRPAIGVSPSTVNLSYSIGTGVTSGAQTSTVMNSGPATSILSFRAAKIQNQSPWLAFTPLAGGPLASGASTPITLSLVNVGLPTIPGMYTEVIAVSSGIASNSPQQILVQLNVTP